MVNGDAKDKEYSSKAGNSVNVLQELSTLCVVRASRMHGAWTSGMDIGAELKNRYKSTSILSPFESHCAQELCQSQGQPKHI